MQGHAPLRPAALRLPLGHPAVASVLAGCRSAVEVDDNADLFAFDIPDALRGTSVTGHGADRAADRAAVLGATARRVYGLG